MEAAKETLRIILISGQRRTATVKAVADCLGKSESAVYQWCDLDNPKHPTCDQVLFLSRWLTEEYGDTRLAGLFVPRGYEIVQTGSAKLNGSLNDELAGLVEHAGLAQNAFTEARWGDAEYHARATMNMASQMLDEIRGKQ